MCQYIQWHRVYLITQNVLKDNCIFVIYEFVSSLCLSLSVKVGGLSKIIFIISGVPFDQWWHFVEFWVFWGDDQHLFVSSLTLSRCMKVNSVVWKSLVTEAGVRRIRRRMIVFPAATLYDTPPVELIITFPFTVHCHKTIGLQERHFKLHPQAPQTN